MNTWMINCAASTDMTCVTEEVRPPCDNPEARAVLIQLTRFKKQLVNFMWKPSATDRVTKQDPLSDQNTVKTFCITPRTVPLSVNHEEETAFAEQLPFARSSHNSNRSHHNAGAESTAYFE